MQIESPEGHLGHPMTSLTPSPNALVGVRVLALDNGKPGAEFLCVAWANVWQNELARSSSDLNARKLPRPLARKS